MIYPHNFEQKIGFDQIRQLLKGKCLSTLGEERVDEMTFSDNYDEINQRLEQVVEFVRITQEEEDFPAQYFFDVRPSLKRIRVEGMYMDEQEPVRPSPFTGNHPRHCTIPSAIRRRRGNGKFSLSCPA